MHDAFSLRRTQKIPKHVVLIDDIVTTGATLHECAKVLQKAGVHRIDAWVIARG
jgi:predicted amidophosphoribosyltransferase